MSDTIPARPDEADIVDITATLCALAGLQPTVVSTILIGPDEDDLYGRYTATFHWYVTEGEPPNDYPVIVDGEAVMSTTTIPVRTYRAP